MRNSVYILPVLFLTACGPCMPRDFGDTSTIIGEVCPPVGDETTEVAPGPSDGSAPSTGDESTTIIDATESSGAEDQTEGPAECTSDDDCAPGEFCDGTKFPFVCEPHCDDPLPIPSKGDEWGSCNDGACNNSGVFCHDIADATICLPACDGGMCSGYFICAGGMCAENGECIPACEVDADCPIVGMVCRSGISAGLVCAWPK